MTQLHTKAIVLKRTDFGEADRIITVLTPDYGKLKLIVKGVRKQKSKLAGGIELFSVSDIGFIQGKGDISTLISARLNKHYGSIVKDINRVQLGYNLLKLLNKATEDQPEAAYFFVLDEAIAAIDNQLDLTLIETWFEAQLIKLAGHLPNLYSDNSGEKLNDSAKYNFDLDSMSFVEHPSGSHHAAQIKSLRLVFSAHSISELSRVEGLQQQLAAIAPLIRAMIT